MYHGKYEVSHAKRDGLQLYSGTEVLSKLAGQGNLQDQETNSFEVPLSLGLSKAFIEEKRKINKKKKTPVQLSSNCYYRYTDKV